jgi:hypothetical protein
VRKNGIITNKSISASLIITSTLLATSNSAVGDRRNLKEAAAVARPAIAFEAIRTVSVGVTRLYKWVIVVAGIARSSNWKRIAAGIHAAGGWSDAVARFRGKNDTRLLDAVNRFVIAQNMSPTLPIIPGVMCGRLRPNYSRGTAIARTSP